MTIRTATFLAKEIADTLADNVKMEGNYTLSKVADFIPWFRELAKEKGALHRVDIFTHSSMPAHLANCADDPVASCGPIGAYGLIVGGETLNLGRTNLFQLLKGAFSHMGVINLRACGIAGQIEDPKSRQGPAVWSGNGIKFCQAIADFADCMVRGSPAFQKYTVDVETSWWGLTETRTNYDPGPWEGPVFLFEPGKGTPIRE